MEFILRWRLLNYDLNSLKVLKLANEAETRRWEAWAGVRSTGLWPTLGTSGDVGAEPPQYGLGFCYIILL
jgi:hypothetical protein